MKTFVIKFLEYNVKYTSIYFTRIDFGQIGEGNSIVIKKIIRKNKGNIEISS